MTFIEKYIREKLGSADAPPELDANDLWAGIESQLSPEDEMPPVVASFPWKGIIAGFLLLLVAGSAWLFYIRPSPEALLAEDTPTETVAANSQISSPQATKDTLALSTTGGTVAIAEDSPFSASSIAPRSATAQRSTNTANGKAAAPLLSRSIANKSKPIPTGQPQQYSSVALQKSAPVSPPSSTNFNTADDDYIIVFSPIEAEDPVSEKPSTAPAAAPSSEASAAQQVTDDSPIASEPTATNESVPQTRTDPATEEVISEPAKAEVSEKADDEQPDFKSRRGSRLSLGLHAGTNLLARQYANNGEELGEKLNTAVSSAAGTSFGLDLTYRITDKLSVTTGLAYHRTLNPFDHATVTDTMITHPSAFNSGLINAIARRRTTHNHRLSFLTVPLLVNRTWTFGNFDLGVGVGLGLNLKQSATGKTLDANGLVVAYNNASGTADVPDFFLSYRLRPMLSWQPKPGSKLRFEFTGNLSYQSFGVSPLSGVKQNGLLFGGNIGLRYGL